MSSCQSLFNAGLADIAQSIRAAPSLSLFFDFDGTLAPIVEEPGEARLEESGRELLAYFAHRPDILTVVISGRGLSDLQSRVGVEGIVYAANHGLEIRGRGLNFVEPFAAARQDLLSRVSHSLAANLSGISGVRVEYKGLTASVHYRQASPASMRDIERIAYTVVAPEVSPFFLNPGRMVLEVMPRSNWHKGAAVCWINSRLAGPSAASIYVGDDRTDEAAFRELPDQITVCVGRPDWSSAKFHVSDPGDVHQFLTWLKDNRQQTVRGGAI